MCVLASPRLSAWQLPFPQDVDLAVSFQRSYSDYLAAVFVTELRVRADEIADTHPGQSPLSVFSQLVGCPECCC